MTYRYTFDEERMRRMRGYGALACVLMLAACSVAPVRKPPPKTDVSYEAVADKHLKHYHLEPAQTPQMPAQYPDNPAPVYPPALVSQGMPPVDVTALLIVDAQGRVTAVRIDAEATDDATRKAFDDAVRTAALQWRFIPLRIATWETDAQGNEHRVRADPKPFSQIYRFHFEVQDGQPVVRAGAPVASSSGQR